MARRFRKMRISRTKSRLQHANTSFINSGSADVPDSFVICSTQAGARDLAGGTSTVQSSRTTSDTCNIGDIIKQVNLFIQAGPRQDGAGLGDEKRGWLEWGLVCVKESEAVVPITDMGIQTLGVVLNQMFRNECIFTGALPIGNEIPNYLPIIIKIPKFKQKLTYGDEWRFYTYWRSTDSAAMGTAEVRVVKSFIYNGWQ